jgi:hypothetical protein
LRAEHRIRRGARRRERHRRLPAGGRRRHRELQAHPARGAGRGWRAAVPPPSSGRRWGAIFPKARSNMSCRHESHAFGGRQLLEHHEQCQANQVGQQRFALGVVIPGGGLRPVRGRGLQGLLAARFAAPQQVEADAGGHRCQPPLQVVDVVVVRTAEPQPRLLDGVLRLGARAEHAVGDRPQVAPGWPRIALPEVFFRPSVTFPWLRSVMAMTDETRPM